MAVHNRATWAEQRPTKGLPGNSGGSAQQSYTGTTETSEGLPGNSGGRAQQSYMGAAETTQGTPGKQWWQIGGLHNGRR